MLVEFKRRDHKECIHQYTNTGIDILKFSNKKAGCIFAGIVRRCYDKTDESYRFYGGKGITICGEWLYEPDKFSSWYVENLKNYKNDDVPSIDRIDSSLGYSPENCRIISLKENSRWKSSTVPITICGMTKTGRQWSEFLGRGTNYINTMRREHSEEYVKEYISSQIGKQQTE